MGYKNQLNVNNVWPDNNYMYVQLLWLIKNLFLMS